MTKLGGATAVPPPAWQGAGWLSFPWGILQYGRARSRNHLLVGIAQRLTVDGSQMVDG